MKQLQSYGIKVKVIIIKRFKTSALLPVPFFIFTFPVSTSASYELHSFQFR